MKRLLLKIISAAALIFLFFFNSANAATSLTIATVTTTAGNNGLASSPLSINQTGVAVMGFSTVKAGGTVSLSQFVFTGSAAIATNFSNLKLYSSTNNSNYDGSDVLISSTPVISGTTATFTVSVAATNATVYYFLVADYTVASSTSSTYTFSITGLTNNAATTTGLPKSGPAYTLSSATCDWTGNTSTTWTTASNWSNNHVPGPYDNVNIAVNVQISGSNVIPVITASTTIASLKFAGYFSSGGVNFPGITVNGTAVTLTITGDMTFDIDSNPGTFDYTATPSTPYPVTIYTNKFLIGGTGTISATNLYINANYGSLATAQQAVQQAVISSIANLTLSGNLALTSENYKTTFSSVYNQIASFYLTGGTTEIGGKINMTNIVSGTTTYPVSGVIINPASSAGATLQLDDPAALSTLTASGSNYFDLNNLYAEVDYAGTGQTVYTSSAANVYGGAGINYYDLTLSGGTQTPAAGTITVTDNFTSTATAANFNTNNTVLTVGQTAQITSGVVNAGSGAITVSGPTKILSGATLNAGTAAASSLTMSGAYTNSSGGTFTAGGGNVYFNSAYTNNGTFTAGSGTVNFNLAGGQALNDGSTAGTLFNNVSFNGAGTKKIISGNFGVSSTGILSVLGTSTTKFDPSGLLTMYASSSTPLAYAQIAPVTGQITGSINYQVYFQGGAGYRNYRSMASPVYTGTFSTSNGTYPLSTLKGSFIITGTSGSTNGFDKSFNNGFTLKTYSPAIGYSFITSLLTNPTIATGSGFYMYYRGNRTVPSTGVTATDPFGSKTNKSSTGSYSVPESVTYTYTGIPNQGSYSLPAFAATDSRYYFVANPYAATLDATAVINSAVTGVVYYVNTKTWVWSPSVANYAVYNVAVPALSTNGAKQYLVPGQGFFIQAATLGTAKTVTLTETMKSVNNNLNAARFLYTADPVAKDEMPIFRVQFIKDHILSDEIAVGLTDSAKAGYDKNDATHLEGSSLTLSSLTPDNQYLAVDVRPFTAKSTVIPLYITPDIDTTYSMKLSYKNTSMSNFKVLLADSLLGKTTDISNAAYTFKVTPGTANTYGKRFKLFVQAQTAPVVFADFTGSIDKTKTVTLKWTSENTIGNIHYQVQRSADKTTFTNIGSTVLSPSTEEPVKTTYTVLDNSPLVGLNYYRLVQTDMFGNVLYSDTITVANNPGFANGVAKTGFILYPNPVKDVLSIVSDKSFSKKVVMKIYDTQGTLRFTQTYNDGITAQMPVQAFVNKLQTGVYVVLITNNEKELVALRFKKQ